MVHSDSYPALFPTLTPPSTVFLRDEVVTVPNQSSICWDITNTAGFCSETRTNQVPELKGPTEMLSGFLEKQPRARRGGAGQGAGPRVTQCRPRRCSSGRGGEPCVQGFRTRLRPRSPPWGESPGLTVSGRGAREENGAAPPAAVRGRPAGVWCRKPAPHSHPSGSSPALAVRTLGGLSAAFAQGSAPGLAQSRRLRRWWSERTNEWRLCDGQMVKS